MDDPFSGPGMMETRDSRQPPGLLPLRQRQLPLPFILPEKLGPLPAPPAPRPPPPVAARSDVPLIEVRPALTPGQHRDIRHGLPSHSFTLAPRQQQQNLGTSQLPLPPPLPPLMSRSSVDRTYESDVKQDDLYQRHIEPMQKLQRPTAHVHHHHHNGIYDEQFTPRTDLSSHTPIIVRYPCDKCHETFVSNGALKRHKKSHLERSFHCVCGAAYTDVAILRVSSPFFTLLFSTLISHQVDGLQPTFKARNRVLTSTTAQKHQMVKRCDFYSAASSPSTSSQRSHKTPDDTSTPHSSRPRSRSSSRGRYGSFSRARWSSNDSSQSEGLR